MGEIVQGTDPTLWVFFGLAIVVAFLAGMAALGATQGIRYYSRQLRETHRQEPSVAQRIEAAEQTVAAPDYGRLVVVDPEPTVPIPPGYVNAGLGLPPRAGVVLAEPPQPEDLGPVTDAGQYRPHVAKAVVVAAEIAQMDAAAVLDSTAVPAAPVEPEREDEHDDDPPGGSGGAPLDATAIEPRHDRAHLRGEMLPVREYVLPLERLRRAGNRTLAYLKAPIVVTHLTWPARAAMSALRADMTVIRSETAAVWDQRPWMRSDPAKVKRGRHRTGVAHGTAEQRRVVA